VACNGLHSVAQRCCRWLLVTHDGAEGADFRLTHAFLAMMIGVRRASVSLVFSSLQDRGLIRYSRGKVRVVKRKPLEAVSCPSYRRVREDYDRLLS
jgi:CRP-like cAMP-binding protein